MENKKILENYWLKYYYNKETGLCSLCGNTGILDTTNTAISPMGIKVGRRNYCFCPNGRDMNPND